MAADEKATLSMASLPKNNNSSSNAGNSSGNGGKKSRQKVKCNNCSEMIWNYLMHASYGHYVLKTSQFYY